MLFSKDFVFIHVPRMGGNFVRTMLFKLQLRHRSLWTQGKYYYLLKCKHPSASRILHTPYPPLSLRSLGKLMHRGFNCVPQEHRHKQILAAQDDPLAFYASCYKYPGTNDSGVWDWRKSYRRATGKDCPSFREFMRFFNEVRLPRLFLSRTGGCTSPPIGFLTFQYLWLFLNDPATVLTQCSGTELDEYFESGRYKSTLCQVRFLRKQHLNQDLHAFLLRSGFPRNKLGFILRAPPVNTSSQNTSPRSGERRSAFYDQELIDYVRTKDRIYYRWFLGKNLVCNEPQEQTSTGPQNPDAYQ